jgi:hypothetical protein
MSLRAKMSLARRDNTAGNLPIILLADVEDFDSIAQATPPSITISGNHTFVTDKGFSELEASAGTVTDEAEGSTEPDSTGERAKIMAFYPGEHEDILQDVKDMKKGRFIILKPNIDDNTVFIQFGADKYRYAVLESYKFSSGDFLGRKGFELVFRADVTTKYFYEGAVTLQPEATEE